MKVILTEAQKILFKEAQNNLKTKEEALQKAEANKAQAQAMLNNMVSAVVLGVENPPVGNVSINAIEGFIEIQEEVKE